MSVCLLNELMSDRIKLSFGIYTVLFKSLAYAKLDDRKRVSMWQRANTDEMECNQKSVSSEPTNNGLNGYRMSSNNTVKWSRFSTILH